ncbi:18024_t:CDS:1, partial [Racocetra fulgida]
RKKEDKLQDADSLDDCELIQQDSSKILPEEDITHATIVVESSESVQHKNHIEIDYLDLGDLIEQEIQ